jgi:hypothetical protein
MFRHMQRGAHILAISAAALTVGALAGMLCGCGGSADAGSAKARRPGEPSVEIVSPRNGSRQTAHAVVVKTKVRDFELAPRHFGGEPELGQGHIRFALNRVPDCVDPAKLRRAIESPVGRGRLQGASFDFPRYSGPNGVLAERIGASGSYSPATRPEIYYHDLPAGFYRLVVTLAQNDGATTPFHAVTNFQILSSHGRHPCRGGKVSSAKAAAFD